MICMDDSYNKTTKVPTECLFCHEVVCRTCLKLTLLNDTAVDICCPGCRAVWSQEFLVANLPVTFRAGELKKHREKVLYDREKARLPEFMDAGRRYKEALAAVTPLREQLAALKSEYETKPLVADYKKKKEIVGSIKSCFISYHDAHIKFFDARRVVSKEPELIALKAQMRQLKRSIGQYTRIINTLGQDPAVAETTTTAEREIRHRRTVMACPVAGCAGFVDTLWKCGICDTKVCMECRVINLDNHKCKADDIATARAIAAETKPCPKCAASISKVSGCDQMWCTVCHTTFSWNTGKIETAVIHNPHYFQWLAAKGQSIPRADLPGMPCDIDGSIMRMITRLYTYAHLIEDIDFCRERLQMIDKIAERHRQRLDLEAGELTRVRNRVRDFMTDDWRRELCVKRLAGVINEEEWRVALQRAEKAHHKERAWLQLMEMYAVTTRDILGRITLQDLSIKNDANDEILSDILSQHAQLHQFVYEQNLAISKAYGCIIIKITPDMKTPETKKRETKTKKAVGGAGAATVADAESED